MKIIAKKKKKKKTRKTSEADLKGQEEDFKDKGDDKQGKNVTVTPDKSP